MKRAFLEPCKVRSGDRKKREEGRVVPRRYREEFPCLDIFDIRPSFLRNGTRIRCPKRNPDYRFDVRRSQYDQAGLTVTYRGELELRWKGRGKKRRPTWLCGCCGALVDRMYSPRGFYWLCLQCLECEVGNVSRVSKDRRSVERMEILMQAAKWHAGDFSTRWPCFYPATFYAPHLHPEIRMLVMEEWELYYAERERLWMKLARAAGF